MVESDGRNGGGDGGDVWRGVTGVVGCGGDEDVDRE